MRNLFIMSLILTMSLFSTANFSQDNTKDAVKSNEQSKPESKNSRGKKVMMCHECGKPEVDCECEGEGHGVNEDEESDHSH